MRKGGARPHLKRVTVAPKERWCGVPCTLLVAAWTLFILLLLTSSISHRDDEQAGRGNCHHNERPRTALFWSSQASSFHALFGREDNHLQVHHVHCFINEWIDFMNGKKHLERSKADQSISRHFAVLEESDFAVPLELRGVRLVGRGDDLPYGDVGEEFISSSVISSSDESEGRHHFATNRDETEQLPSSIRVVVFPTRINFQELGKPIDALQYAEYGAGLLQRSGPAEESSKICLVRNPREIRCRVISHHSEFSGRKCVFGPASLSAKGQDDLLRPFEFLAGEQEHCHEASSVGGDLVAEIEPGGESYLVCRGDPLPEGTIVCVVAGNAQSECLLPGMDANSHDGPRRDRRLLETPQEGHGQVEGAGSVQEDSVSSELPNSIEAENVQHITIEQPDEELSPPMEINSESNSISQQDEDELRKQPEEGNADEIPQSVVDVDNETKVVEDVIVEEIDVDLEFLTPLVESEAIGRESLVDPAEDGIREEETDFEDEILSAFPVEAQLLIEEPRRLQKVGSVMSLDEYKRSILEAQRKNGNQVNMSSVQVQQKVRHSDESYNYASATHGAKVLASNKEAKGASHVLTSDKDKYLRNPCGAEDKYVVLELSEETFVDTIFISNFEFHSSNLKDFEVLGSPVYPTKDWISLGKFQAENARHRQKFNIDDPKLVRHLMIKMLTHWGSEFFCTLSIVEVFGVDVIKNLLDDWIALEEGENNPRMQASNGLPDSQEESTTPGGNGHQLSDGDAALDAPFTEPLFTQSETGTGSEQHQGDFTRKAAEGLHADEDSKTGSAGDPSAQETMHILGAKPPSESVLKILMQRVKALELNQTLFDLYLGDMNQKYKAMLSELDKDLALVTERLRNQTALTASLAMRLADRELQRKEEKLHMEHRFALIASNFSDNLDFMRWQIQSMERREITAILLAFLCMILSALLHLLANCLPRKNPLQNASAPTRSGELVVVKEELVDSKDIMDSNVGIMDCNSKDIMDSKVGIMDSNSEDIMDSKVGMMDSNSKDIMDSKVGIMDSNSKDIMDSKVGIMNSKSSRVDSKLDSLSLSTFCQCSSSLVLYLACGLTILVLSV